MSEIESKLEKRIRAELDQLWEEQNLTIPSIINRLVPAILDECDEVIEKAWMYDDLC